LFYVHRTVYPMKVTSTPLLAVDLDASALGTGDRAVWLDHVLALESAGVALVTLADRFDAADGVARIDAVMRSAWLAARTSAIGVVAAADTTVTEPYLLAVQIATVDFVSRGRAGWLVQVSGRESDAGYVGPRSVSTGLDAWEEAAEFVEVVRALWDSWEDTAEIRDIPGHRFIDRERVHHIDFEGAYLSVKGPSIAPRSPQGQPPVALALTTGGDHTEVAFGLRRADVLFLGAGFNADGVRSAAAEQGRPVRLFADLAVAEASVGRVGELLSDGFHGVRLIPSASEDLPAVVDLAGALGLSAVASGDAGLLRERLTLRRPASRYAEATS
jgi:alkanesulfonate monooxygenase SsuD/methylene tetrahydromethanopterin reductase-like flavin-dependent oxidoreductase (luciferase family)